MIWGVALREVLSDYAKAEYSWGKTDCIQFISSYVAKRTGINHASRFEYDSEFSALKLMSRHGGIEGLIESCLGDSKPGAKPGDVVVCHSENLHIPGVYNGSYAWAFTEKGLGRLLLQSVVCAWDSCPRQ